MQCACHASTAMREREVEHTGGGSRHHQTEGTMELRDGLWRELPCEVLEQVLPFLTVPDLCRLRSVCKRWNSLITTPEFGALCVQNVTRGVIKGTCFVVKLCVVEESCETGRQCEEVWSWSIFDLNTRRWYSVKDALPQGHDHNVWATDGGLTCTFVTAFTDDQRRASTIDNPKTSEPQVLVVFNLIDNRLKVLPNPPMARIDFPRLNLKLVVDDISHTYKVFLIFVGRIWNSGNPYICVYESSSNQWRSAPIQPEPWGRIGYHVRSVIFQGHLYGLFSSRSDVIGGLYKYSFEDDAWENTGVKFWESNDRFYCDDLSLCDLVVSDNRLFLMTQRLVDRKLRDRVDYVYKRRRDNPAWWPLDISEILLADKVCKTVVQMRGKKVMQNFDIQLNDCGRFTIRADGLDKSILLMSEKVHGGTGKYMLYNLVSGLWEFLPPNPAECLHFRSGYRRSMWRHGKQMSYLRLPNTAWG